MKTGETSSAIWADGPARAGLAPFFPGCLRVNGKRMHPIGQFRRERRINHTVALDPALPFEGGRHDMYSEMRLAARPMAGMALMQM